MPLLAITWRSLFLLTQHPRKFVSKEGLGLVEIEGRGNGDCLTLAREELNVATW